MGSREDEKVMEKLHLCVGGISLVIHKLIIPQLLAGVGVAERHCAIFPAGIRLRVKRQVRQKLINLERK